MQSPPYFRYLVHPRSKYSPQHHVLKHPQLPFLQQCQQPSFIYVTNRKTKSSDRPLERLWSLMFLLDSIGSVVVEYLYFSTISKDMLAMLILWFCRVVCYVMLPVHWVEHNISCPAARYESETEHSYGSLKCDGTRAETRFRLSAKRTSQFKSAEGRQFSQILAAEVCASAVVMLDTQCSTILRRVLATHSIRQFPLHFPSQEVTLRHHSSTGV